MGEHPAGPCVHIPRVQVQEAALKRAESLPLRTAMLLASVLFLPAVCTSSTMFAAPMFCPAADTPH